MSKITPRAGSGQATKKRLNITLSSELNDALASLAKKDAVPQATKATELLRVAIDLEEDYLLGSLAKSRDTKDARYVSHNKAWAS